MNFEKKRRKMLEEQIIARGITNERLIAAILAVPRHDFVEEALSNQAYGDFPLPIGFSQTISQPYIIALSIDSLELKPDSLVLEIGTGSGYQTAILSRLAKKVFSIERISKLLIQAQKTIVKLGYNNIILRLGDGTLGLENYAPFDGIVVSAASPSVPKTLINQLKIEGKLVIPVGSEYSQDLLVITKKSPDNIITKNLGDCRFVKLIGKYGWENKVENNK